MHWRRAGLVIAPGLLALGCSPPEEAVAEVAEVDTIASPATEVDPRTMAPIPSQPVPQRWLGTWTYSHEECEPDSEMTPDKRDIRASVSFEPDRTYRLDVEGYHFEGSYRYDGGQDPRLTLDNMMNFVLEGDTLQNWSEGDAVYQCGRVFVREK